jgi:hypothetical protein
MADVLFVAILVAFFGVAYALVRACDAIIGPDPIPVEEPVDDVEVEAVSEVAR